MALGATLFTGRVVGGKDVLKLLVPWLKSPFIKGLIMTMLVAALAGGGLWHKYKMTSLGNALQRTESRAQQAEERLGRAVVLYEMLRREKVAADEATLQLQARLAKTSAWHRDIRTQIDSAPPAADGPLAPVLRDTLNALRKGNK